MQVLYHFTETIKGDQVVHDMGSSRPPGPEWSRGDLLHTPEVQAGPRLRICFTQSFISYKGWCTWYHSQFLTQTILGPSQSWTTASSVSFGLLFKKVEFRWNWFCVLIQLSGSLHLPHFTRQNFQIHPSDKSRSLWKPHFQLQTSRLPYCKILPLKFHTYVRAEKCLSFSWVLLSSIKFIYPHTTPSIVRGWEVYWGCMTVHRWWEQCPRQTGLQTLPFDSTAHKPAPQWEVAGSGQTCRYVCPWSDAWLPKMGLGARLLCHLLPFSRCSWDLCFQYMRSGDGRPAIGLCGLPASWIWGCTGRRVSPEILRVPTLDPEKDKKSHNALVS